MSNKKLHKYPCGYRPSELHIQEGACPKYSFVSGSCCNNWIIEFRADYFKPDSDELMDRAIKSWNSAKRRSHYVN